MVFNIKMVNESVFSVFLVAVVGIYLVIFYFTIFKLFAFSFYFQLELRGAPHLCFDRSLALTIISIMIFLS